MYCVMRASVPSVYRRYDNESTEVQILGAVYTTREERHRCTLPCPNIAYGRDVLLLTCVILSERGSLLKKRRRLEYLVAYLCFR